MENTNVKKSSDSRYQVNQTYDQDNDSDSHHYIEPMFWMSEINSNWENSPQIRKRNQENQVNKSIRDALPSRHFELTEHSDDESETAGTSVKRSNSNLTMLKFRNITTRQMDGNALFELLSRNSEATNEQLCETLRNVNQSLTLKRQVKARLSQEEAKKENKTVPVIKRIKYHIAMNWQHLCQKCRTILQSMDLWHSHLKAVQGHFGSGVASYFFFLRRLFFLNLLACLLILCFVIVPQVIWAQKNSQGIKSSFNATHFTGVELITGDRSFEDTVMYYGHFTNMDIGGYKIPEAYLFTNVAFIICCIFILTFSVAKSYRVNHIEVKGELKNVFANKVFAAWDYSIEREAAARLKSKSIYNELMELISEEVNDQGPTSMSRKLYLFMWRLLINLLILTAMAGTGFLVHYLLKEHYAEQIGQRINYSIWCPVVTLYLSFFFGYLVTEVVEVDIPVLKEITVALVVTGILFFVPFLFSIMSNWENYASKETQLYLNIIRVVLLRAVILSVVVIFWLGENDRTHENITSSNESQESSTISPTKTQCWETKLGQETYRLIMVDFLCILLLPTLIMEVFRRLFYDYCCKSVGFPEFDIAQNTLDLVYTQMLVWIGFFYSPMLPFIALIKLVIIFYLKRLSVIRNCRPSEKAWRAAHAQTIFLTLTFLSFLLSLCVLGYSILHVVLYYKRATAHGHREMVKLLREQLTLEGKDKVFLLRLFENAMTQQTQLEICNFMRRESNFNDTRDRKDPMKVERNSANLSGKKNFSTPEFQLQNPPNGPITENNMDNHNPRWKKGEEVLNDAHQQSFNNMPREGSPYVPPGANNYGFRHVLDRGDSKPREDSPFTGQGASNYGHRFNAHDGSPFTARDGDSSHEGSPFYGPSLRGHSVSPQTTWDRRASQGSHGMQPISQQPLFMKPAHQHGFRQLTPGSRNSSRQTTPQRF